MIIVWHHRDLRLEDNPALTHAAKEGDRLLPLYIHDLADEGNWSIGAASRWWLHQSLLSLEERYNKKKSFLALRAGDSFTALSEIIKSHKVTEVCWVERSEPLLRSRDTLIAKKLEKLGVKVTVVGGNYLVDPGKIRTGKDKPYTVYTPFYKALCGEEVAAPLRAPSLPPPPRVKRGKISDLDLLPEIYWYQEMEQLWNPGRDGAKKSLKAFVSRQLSLYGQLRDYPSKESTSRLSPHLHFGELSPREVWHSVKDKKGAEPFLRELVWREFSNNFLFYSPEATDNSWRKSFENFPWRKNDKALKRWQQGMTGYPIVDAGMRQLWRTGWMHNRVRMITASFLVKDLMIHWLEGAKWFWDTLVDADLANNSQGWQWVAGSGADAAPFFRVFNPVIQGKRFDPDGEYIRQYIPELKELPSRYIHEPWEASVSLDYPDPIVDHAAARKRALDAFNNL